MLEASLGETVVVVVVLAELAVTVTVTVTSLGFPLVVDVKDEVDREEVLDDESELVDVELSEPVTPPVTPEAFIMATTVLSLVQTIDVPGARRSGIAKHC
jgi:hypothetical protein